MSGCSLRSGLAEGNLEASGGGGGGRIRKALTCGLPWGYMVPSWPLLAEKGTRGGKGGPLSPPSPAVVQAAVPQNTTAHSSSPLPLFLLLSLSLSVVLLCFSLTETDFAARVTTSLFLPELQCVSLLPSSSLCCSL